MYTFVKFEHEQLKLMLKNLKIKKKLDSLPNLLYYLILNKIMQGYFHFMHEEGSSSNTSQCPHVAD